MLCLLNIALSYLSGTHPLPMAILDLYRCFEWAYDRSYAMVVITDHSNLSDYTLEIQTWIQKQKYSAEFVHVLGDALILKNVDNFKAIVNRVLHKDITRCMVYYSGHHQIGRFKLLQQGVDDDIFMTEIVSRVAETAEIFFFMDCCYAPHFDLPYVLNNNRFILRKDKTCKFQSRVILVLSACDEKERVITKEEGSLISGGWWQLQPEVYTYNMWNQNKCVPANINRNLEHLRRRMISIVNDRQHVQFYSSYVIDPILWLWIGRKYPFTDVVTDLSGSVLIRRIDC